MSVFTRWLMGWPSSLLPSVMQRREQEVKQAFNESPLRGVESAFSFNPDAEADEPAALLHLSYPEFGVTKDGPFTRDEPVRNDQFRRRLSGYLHDFLQAVGRPALERSARGIAELDASRSGRAEESAANG